MVVDNNKLFTKADGPEEMRKILVKNNEVLYAGLKGVEVGKVVVLLLPPPLLLMEPRL